MDRDTGRELGHARLLLLDEAREQVGPDRVRQRANDAARVRPRLRQLSSWTALPTPDRRQLRERALQLHEEQRRLRRLVEASRAASGFGFGWDYNHLDQTRVDYDKSHWNKLWAEYKNTMFDTVSGRLKYQYIKRDSTLNFTNDPLPDGGANNPNYLLPFTSAFDLQSNTTEPGRSCTSTGAR